MVLNPMNLPVAPIAEEGGVFLTEPLDNHAWELRCYMRDPDGYIIEVGQYTQSAIDHFRQFNG
jgi:hypothetical protein